MSGTVRRTMRPRACRVAAPLGARLWVALPVAAILCSAAPAVAAPSASDAAGMPSATAPAVAAPSASDAAGMPSATAPAVAAPSGDPAGVPSLSAPALAAPSGDPAGVPSLSAPALAAPHAAAATPRIAAQAQDLEPAPGAAPDENADLDRIPAEVQQTDGPAAPGAAPAPQGNPTQRRFIEEAATANAYRSHLWVPLPPGQSQPAWQERLSLDSRGENALGGAWRLVHSARFNLFGQDTTIFPSEQTKRLDVRELYASWEPVARIYLDGGRINVKNGVAVGFNPTDYFKTRAVVDRTSQDPAVLRENRLGTALVRGQALWDGGAVMLAAAPKLNEPSRIYDDNRLPSFEPMFDRTNGQQRTLVKANFDLPGELTGEVLALQADARSQFGLNLTLGLGKAVVAYAEWSGGDRASQIAEALAYGKLTRTFPPGAPRVLPGSGSVSFQQDLAAGASYTTETKVTLYLEYDYHQAGFTAQDWRNWYRLGRALRSIPQVAGQLWYIRSYASDQGEPASRESVVTRLSWTDAFVRDLELTALANFSQYDDSAQVQVTASYFVNDRWTVALLGLSNAGARRSVWGSLPLESSWVVKATRYL